MLFRSRQKVYSRCGGSLNYGGLQRFLTQWDSSRLFLRRPMRQGWSGTIVIDASGSMGVSSQRLIKLCSSLPGATVAYYCGAVMPQHPTSYGTLTVFARGGLRIDCQSAPYHEHSNEVDAAAIQWLTQQPGPRVLVSDLEFCGGAIGQVDRAKMLLRFSPDIKVIQSIEDAWRQLVGSPEPTEV